jgi:hypothetical protein
LSQAAAEPYLLFAPTPTGGNTTMALHTPDPSGSGCHASRTVFEAHLSVHGPTSAEAMASAGKLANPPYTQQEDNRLDVHPQSSSLRNTPPPTFNHDPFPLNTHSERPANNLADPDPASMGYGGHQACPAPPTSRTSTELHAVMANKAGTGKTTNMRRTAGFLYSPHYLCG